MKEKKEKKGQIILIDKDTGEIILEGEIIFLKKSEKEKWIFQDRKYKIEIDVKEGE